MKHLRKLCLLLGFALILFAGCEKDQGEMPLASEIRASRDCYRPEEGLKLHFSGLPPAASSQVKWYIWVAGSEEEINISENNVALKTITGTHEVVLPDTLLRNAEIVVATAYFFLEGEKAQTKFHSYSKTKDPSDCVEWEEIKS